jgi:hypothetical protein
VVADLKPGQFVVRIDGVQRSVVSADWIQQSWTSGHRPRSVDGYTSNEIDGRGRLIVIVVDQPDIRFGGTVFIRDAIDGLIDRLAPADKVAIVGIGPGTPSVLFTANHDLLKSAIAKSVGQRGVPAVDIVGALEIL